MTGETPVRPKPPALYHAWLWHFGLWIVRAVPASWLKALFRSIARAYVVLRRARAAIVTRNLLPVLGGNKEHAVRVTRAIHKRFAEKLVDLWRLESGLAVQEWITRDSEVEILRTAADRGKGVLFITLHLGNWEHGGTLLSKFQLPLTVLTLAEPDGGLTELRKTLRKRYGVETLTIGQDIFAFVEVIKRLQGGAALAISLDRPPARQGVEVKFFGHKFMASSAAADLARASGCALVGVVITRRTTGFAVRVLPEFEYERKALGTREERAELTQKILRAFEPLILEDIEQWYQFVPIWPDGGEP